MKRTVCTILFLTLSACFVFHAGCRPEKSSEIRIGGMFDVTGATREISVAYADGIRLYIEYINKAGGVNGRPVHLIEMDYGYLIPRAKTVYEKLVNEYRVHAILGWGTGSTEYLRPRVASDRIPFMSASYSAKLTDINDSPYNFLIGVTYSDQMRIALKYILDQWKNPGRAPRVAFIFNDTEFGRSPVPDGISYAAKHGIDLVAQEVVSLDAREAREQLGRIRDKKADYVIIQETTWATAVILKDARRMGLPISFIGLSWSSDEKLIALAGRASEGFTGTIPFIFTDRSFPGIKPLLEYSRTKGLDVEDYISRYIQGWVTALVMVEGIRRAGDDISGPGIRKGLETIRNFDTGGITAPLTFTPSTHAGCRSLKLGQVKNGRWRIISEYLSADINRSK